MTCSRGKRRGWIGGLQESHPVTEVYVGSRGIIQIDGEGSLDRGKPSTTPPARFLQISLTSSVSALPSPLLPSRGRSFVTRVQEGDGILRSNTVVLDYLSGPKPFQLVESTPKFNRIEL